MTVVLKASTQQLREYLKRVDDGRVKDAALRHAMHSNMTADEVAVAVYRVRDARARLELQSAPAKYKPAGKRVTLPDVGTPTPEWLARNEGNIETRTAGSDIRVKGYRAKHILDALADKLPIDQKTATERYLQDSQWHEKVKIADWNGSGGGSGLARLGGLGDVPQAVRDGHYRFEWVNKHFGPAMMKISKYLILRVESHADQSPFSLEDFGRLMFPDDRGNKWSLTCYAKGAVYMFGDQLSFLYNHPSAPRVYRITDEEREYAFFELRDAGKERL